MPKKILVFSTAYFPLVGGAEVAIDEIAKRLSDYHFDMVTAKIKPGLACEEKYNNVHIYRVGFGKNIDKMLLPFLGLIKAQKLEKKNKYDLIWSMMASFGGFLGLFFKYLHPAKPWLLTLQEGDPPEYILKRVGIFRPLFYQIFRRADYIQAISSFLKKWSEELGAKCLKTIMPNAVNIKHFSRKYPQEELNKLRKDLGLGENDKIIITTSRLSRKNAVDDVIRAMAVLKKQGKTNYKFLILGVGEDEEKLKNLVDELRVRDQVIFVGFVKHDEMPKYLKISDVFIRPSLSEGLGNSFLEAMAAGLPVIATPVGGIPDFLFDGKTGLFCKVRNPESIADKINKILSNNELKEKLIKNGGELVKSKYDWDIIAKQMKEIFDKIKTV